ncbi:MAG: N-acetylmuramoyl-L-alanine amidase [Clostridia bacterium]|nr:N-acetylmuramoyl-L-alanine amidase [Clostridia bacterium]
MLDAGHYGDYNRSPAVPEYYESRMSWALHLKLKSELEKYGFEVGTTRPDRFTDLEVYARGFKARGYDIFLSLHSNAVGGGVREDIDRPVVIRLANDTDGDGFAQRLADMLAGVMATKQAGQVSTRLQENGAEYYGVLRGAKAAGCPHAYIIEHSFHTATAPTRFLLDDGNLDLLARREAALLAEFFGIEATRKEEEAMTAEERRDFDALKARVTELEEQNRVYRWYSELPDYARPTIERLHRSGVFSGAGPGDMQLSRDMMRILLILANQNVI